MIDVALALPFARGMVAAFNPCGFAMLPAYLSYFLGLEDEEADAKTSRNVVRGVLVGLTLAAGFFFVFLLAGLAFKIAVPSRWLEELGWFAIATGILMIPLGIATEKTGTAAWIAHSVLNVVGTVSPVILLTVIAVLSTGFTLVISNVGATVLLIPLVVNMAIAAGTDPRMAALVVGLATSNSFMLPTHQVNALYMGPGRYRSVDYMKAGGIMTIIFIVVLIAMLNLLYGI